MQRLGIQTGADLRGKSLSFLQQHFGKSATWYHNIANGEDERPVVADRPRKSSGSETTFERDLTSPAEIEAGAEAMADDVWGWCEQAKAFGRTVTVKVKFADFHQITRSRSLPTPVARRDLLRQLSVDLVRTVLPAAKGVRLIGVTVSNFDQRPTTTAGELPLLPSEDTSTCDNDE
jgi:DNA polymerase-4